MSHRIRRSLRRNAAGYLFLTPWLIGFFGLTLGPTLASLYLSFTDYDLLTPARWAGLKRPAATRKNCCSRTQRVNTRPTPGL